MSKLAALAAAVLLGLAACLLVFAALAGQSAVLASDLRDAPEEPASRNRQLFSPAPEPAITVPEFFVVRVNYTSRAELDRVASWLEPWEVHPEEQYFVVGVTRAELERLVGSGLSVQILPNQAGVLSALPEADPAQASGIPGFACYRTVDETLATATGLAQDYPGLVEWVDIGDSWEKQDGQVGDDLVVLRITNRAATHPKPSLFILSSIHARELTPAELNTRFAELLVTSYGVDPDITWLLDYTEIHLLLQANPDGRRYAELATYPYNYWRKNTNNNYCSDTNSRGADLNRNFSFLWNSTDDGSSDNMCDGTYHGPSAASEPETNAIEQYVRTIFPDQRGTGLEDAAPLDAQGIFMDLHSYSRLVLWPWGYTGDNAPNGTALQTLGRKFAYFNQYTPVQAYDLYITDGTTDDFAYGELGLAAFTFELGNTFFESCTTFENVILPDNLPALLYAAKAARAPYVIPSGPDVTSLVLSSAAVVQGDVVTLTAVLDDSRYRNNGTTEPVQAIAGGELYIDLPPWADQAGTPVILPAQDGLFNSSQETVAYPFDTSQLTPGRHLLFVRGLDAAGNWGAFSAVFLDVQGIQASFVSSSPNLLGSTTLFTDTSIGENLSHLWEFGDGSSGSGGGVVTHTYLTSGSYPVTLTVSNTLGTSQAFGMVFIQDIWMYMFPILQDALPAP